MSGIKCESCGIGAKDFFGRESDGSIYKTYDEFEETIKMVNTNDDNTITWYCTTECYESEHHDERMES